MVQRLLNRHNLTSAALAGAVVTLGGVGETQAADDDFGIADVPDKIKKAADSAIAGVKWTDATKNTTSEGVVLYTLEGKDARDRDIEAEITADGTVNKVERQIDTKDVPRVVMSALTARMPKYTVTKVAEYIVEQEVVAYQFEGTRPKSKGREIFVLVSRDGKKVAVDE